MKPSKSLDKEVGVEEGNSVEVTRKKVRFSPSTQTSPKTKTNLKFELVESDIKTATSLKPHPLGIKPLGNFYIDKEVIGFVDRRSLGLGTFRLFSDQLLLEILDLLDPLGVAKLSFVSKYFYCLSYYEEFWKEKYLSEFSFELKFKKSWRISYLTQSYTLQGTAIPKLNKYPVVVDYIYSDTMFQPWLYTSLDFSKYLGRDTIERRSNLTLEQFIQQYETPNVPVILTDVVDKWEAYREWDCEKLLAQYKDVKFRAEAVDVTLGEYLNYASTQTDESPLYLFDKKFHLTCPQLINQYTVPKYFDSDLFQYLDLERPDFRWLIVGPERSGSTFHKDPNATSAWNGVVQGKKKWILFPPQLQPPGIFTNSDQSEVTAPISIMEWHLHYYRQTCKLLAESKNLPRDQRPVEGICNRGEVIFVPSGWWHLVVNLEFSIAVTQNFVSPTNLPKVLKFLKEKGDQVSGFKGELSLYESFKLKYGAKDPSAFQLCEQSFQKKEGWKNLLKQSTDGGAGFSFGFQLDDDNDEDGEE